MSTTPDPSMPARAWLYTAKEGGTFASTISPNEADDYFVHEALVRQRDAEAALAALRERLEGAEKLLKLAYPEVDHASTRYYDGTGGYIRREEARKLLDAMNAHLAASKGADRV